MIFATVGSHPTFKFDRLLRALDSLPGEELVVQYGPGEPPRRAREATAFMSFEQVLERMREASVVVSHAGVGSILCAINTGHVPVVMPREARHAETVDDHQVELARALLPSERIIVVESAEAMPAAIAEAGSRSAQPTGDATGLVDAVRSELGLA